MHARLIEQVVAGLLYVQLQNDAKLVSESTRLVAYCTTGGEDRLNLSSKGYVPGPRGRREHSCGNQPPCRNQYRLRSTLVRQRRNRLVACSRFHTQYGTIRRSVQSIARDWRSSNVIPSICHCCTPFDALFPSFWMCKRAKRRIEIPPTLVSIPYACSSQQEPGCFTRLSACAPF